MLFDIFRFLLESAAGLLVFCLFLRALMQWVRLHPRNPIAPFVFAMTDWLVRPLRRVVPGFGGIDWASLLGALFIALGMNFLLLTIRWLTAGEASSTVNLFGLFVSMGLPAAILWLVRTAVYLLMGIVFLQAVLSWVNPNSPLSSVLHDLSRPFLEPLRRVMPTIGQVDLSPLVLFVLLQIVMMIVQQLTMSWMMM